MTTKEQILELVKRLKEEKYKENNPIYQIIMAELASKKKKRMSRELETLGFSLDTPAGFFYDIDTAIRALNQNWADLQDACFDAAFIVPRFPGLYDSTTPESRLYFEWDEERKGFFQQEEPDLFRIWGI